MESVLVTGGAGFIGSHVCKKLSEAGFLPIAYDDLSSGFSWAIKWGPLIEGQIEDRLLLKKTLQKYNPIAVMHFAALTDARRCQQKPLHYYRSNVAGTLSVLETLQSVEIPYFIFSSTCAVYGAPNEIPIEETHPKKPINIYGETKWIGEKMVQSLPIPSAILRYFNAAGADPEGELGESHNPATHLIPILIDTAHKKRENFILFGEDHLTKDGTPIRDYIHVTDLATAHVLALQYLIQTNESLTLNLGTGKGYSVRDILQRIQSQFNVKIPFTVGLKNPKEPPYLIAKSHLANQILKWKPHFSDLTTILETTWKWQIR